MEFIKPLLLWGAAAVIIPVAIHFWHQKQGNPLPWAATRWLTEKEQQQSRGFKLDNVPLLLVRCLALLLLAFLLSQPILNWLKKENKQHIVHLVQPNELVTTNFRFELAEAAKRGESVLWATATPESVRDKLETLPTTADFNPLSLQTAIHRLPAETTELHMYLVNNQALVTLPVITVPERFRLHTVVDSTKKPRAYLAGKASQKLFVSNAGKLTNSAEPDPAIRLQANPAHSGTIRVLIDYQTVRQRQAVRAALNALSDVYGLALAVDEKPSSNATYDWVLTENMPPHPGLQTLYIVSGNYVPIAADNVVYTSDLFSPQTSDRVANGQLPEWLGEQLVHHYALSTNKSIASQSELNQLFRPVKKQDKQQQAGIQQIILLLLIVLFMLERWIALTKNT